MVIKELAIRSMSHDEIRNIMLSACNRASTKLLAMNYRMYDVQIDVLVSDCSYYEQCGIANDTTDIFIGYRDKETFELDLEVDLDIDDPYCPTVVVYTDRDRYTKVVANKGGVNLWR